MVHCHNKEVMLQVSAVSRVPNNRFKSCKYLVLLARSHRLDRCTLVCVSRNLEQMLETYCLH